MGIPEKLQERFELKRSLGAGGMATVYEVFDHKEEKPAALKVAHENSSKLALLRFRREFDVMSSLEHENIVHAYFFQETTKDCPQACLAMEYFDAEPLSKSIYDSSLGFDSKVKVLLAVASALQCAHEGGYVHRDLKPDNILLSHDGGVKLIDFGVAVADKEEELRLTKSGGPIGTLYYMSPEQLRQELSEKSLDHRADIYSFGVLAFELFSGRRPFDASTPLKQVLSQAQGIPELCKENADLPEWVDDLVKLCAEREVEYRFQSMDEVIEFLDDMKDVRERAQKSVLARIRSRIFGQAS